MNIINIFICILITIFIFYIVNLYYKKEKLDVAVIVEPRKDNMLIKVLHNFLEFLPKYTQIHIFHGTDNEEFIFQHFHSEIGSNKIILTNLNKKNLNINEYNQLLTSEKFYNSINGENILIFQMDTCLCSNPKYKIEDFLIYDYVGAPWIDRRYVNKVGNGGLSLRKKSKILKHIRYYKYDFTKEPEDLYFSKSDILYFPSTLKASYFSTEHLLNPYSIGVHKGNKTLKEKDQYILEKTCPEFKKILKSN